MILYYYRVPHGNFGDDLNPWLWPKLFGVSLDSCFDAETLFVGIGSLINHRIPQAPPKKVVFGTGCGYGDPPPITPAWRFHCVRGPLTARLLNLSARTALGDGAMLVRELMEPASRPEFDVAYMPHHESADHDDWRTVCDSLGVRYVDPAAPVVDTLEVIRRSALMVTESMHGAIIADAFRVPWIPVRTRPRILPFKWQDWAGSLELEHAFEWVPPAWKRDIDTAFKRRVRPVSTRIARERLRWLIRFGRRRLSRDDVFDRVRRRMGDALREMVGQAVAHADDGRLG